MKYFHVILYLGVVIVFTAIIIMTVQDNFTSKLKKTRKHHINALNNIMGVFLRRVPQNNPCPVVFQRLLRQP